VAVGCALVLLKTHFSLSHKFLPAQIREGESETADL
jgi:hypothetical protein